MSILKHALLVITLLLPISVYSAELSLAPLYRIPINWTDDTGSLVSLSKYQGKPVIISMAYSTCRKFCPMTLARMLEIQKMFEKRNIDAEFVMISYDPASDNWHSWQEYRKAHNLQRSNWHFLTGTPEDTKTISELLGMDFWLYDEHVMHNFKIVRLSVDGNIEKVLDWDHQQEIDSLIPSGY